MSEGKNGMESSKDLEPIREELSSMTEEQIVELVYDLRQRSTKDSLTGLLNRQAWMETTQKVMEAERRIGFDTKESTVKNSILFFDLDGFKDINDNLGHPVGDYAIQVFADLLKDNLSRGSDILGRWGGDEFMAFLPQTSLEEANRIKEQILVSLNEIESTEEGNLFGEYPLRASIGVTEVLSEETVEGALKRADSLMYQEKEKRKNG